MTTLERQALDAALRLLANTMPPAAHIAMCPGCERCLSHDSKRDDRYEHAPDFTTSGMPLKKGQ